LRVHEESKEQAAINETPKARLEKARQRLHPNLSKERFAEKMGIERTQFYRLQRGQKVSAKTLQKVSAYTGIAIADLDPLSSNSPKATKSH
jgi:transcriptional regulator with XRE-family HTH domain